MNQLTKDTTEILLATTEEQIRSCYRVIQQLRPHLTEEQAFVEQVQRQLAAGHHFSLDFKD